MLNEQQRQFLNDNRFCVVSYGRKAGPPAMSPVYYVMDGDDMLISTQAGRAKGKTFATEGDVSICVLAEQHPTPRYLTLYGKARTEMDGATDLLVRIMETMSGNPLPEAVRPGIAAKAQAENRVVLRVTPEAAVALG